MSTDNPDAEPLYSNLAVAVDDSDAGRYGLHLAGRIARRDRARVEVIHVHHIAAGAAEAVVMPEVERSMHETEATVRGWAEAELQGVSWTLKTAEGAVGPAILDLAQAAGCDLIVIGSNRHSMLHNLLLGSTTQNLLDHSPISILVARSKAAEGHRARGGDGA